MQQTLSCSIAISVKMSVLLYLPAYLVVLVKQRGLVTATRLCLTIISVQGLFAYPFLREHPLPYFNYAFNFERVFLYKWTVNWRFLSEEKFLDPNFANLSGAIRHPSRPGSRVSISADGAYAGIAWVSRILTTSL